MNKCLQLSENRPSQQLELLELKEIEEYLASHTTTIVCFDYMNIRSLFLSLAFLAVPIASAQACLGPQLEFSILLDKAPKNSYGASFDGRVKTTRVTDVGNTTIVRAIVKESSTHPLFKGRKMMFFYENTLSCGTFVPTDEIGFLMGRTLKLEPDILVVDPYQIRGVGEEELLTREQMQETLRTSSRGWGIREVYTGEGVIPLWKFYFENLDIESDT